MNEAHKAAAALPIRDDLLLCLREAHIVRSSRLKSDAAIQRIPDSSINRNYSFFNLVKVIVLLGNADTPTWSSLRFRRPERQQTTQTNPALHTQNDSFSCGPTEGTRHTPSVSVILIVAPQTFSWMFGLGVV